jgi:hypothetical protein
VIGKFFLSMNLIGRSYGGLRPCQIAEKELSGVNWISDVGPAGVISDNRDYTSIYSISDRGAG